LDWHLLLYKGKGVPTRVHFRFHGPDQGPLYAEPAPIRFGTEEIMSDSQSVLYQGTRDRRDSFPGIAHLVARVPPGLVLPKNKKITISVITGPSKGLAVQMVKPHLSIGRNGGGADIEIDDPQVSDLHCAVGVKNEIVRMCDLDSQGGTYIQNERVEVADLAHLSEFRVGASLLLVTILPTQDALLTPAV
jgi:hypothetical protein